MKITVSTKELKAALIFASTDEARYILNGVCIEAKPDAAPLIIATDGRRLAVIESIAEQVEPVTEPGQVVIESSIVKAISQLTNKVFPLVTIEVKPGSKRALFHLIGGRTVLDVEEGALIEGTYPNWRQVVPGSDGRAAAPHLSINSTMASDFSKAAKLLEAKSPVISMTFSGAEGVVEVRIADHPQFYGVVMPCKGEAPNSQPRFLGVPEVKKAA